MRYIKELCRITKSEDVNKNVNWNKRRKIYESIKPKYWVNESKIKRMLMSNTCEGILRTCWKISKTPPINHRRRITLNNLNPQFNNRLKRSTVRTRIRFKLLMLKPIRRGRMIIRSRISLGKILRKVGLKRKNSRWWGQANCLIVWIWRWNQHWRRNRLRKIK